MTRTASFDSLTSKTSFHSSLSERGRTRTRSSASSAHADTTVPTISEPTKAPRRKSKHMNGYTTCGRHTDEFLFSGPSLADMARSLFARSRSRRRDGKDEN